VKSFIKYIALLVIIFSSPLSPSPLSAMAADIRLVDINITNAFFYVPLPGSKTTMAFFTITNNSNTDVTITSVSSPAAKQLRLMPDSSLLVPAHQSVALKASGRYLQINELKTKLSTGDELQLTVSLSTGKHLQILAVAKSAYDQLHGH
jgi:copper(I)-binding protein